MSLQRMLPPARLFGIEGLASGKSARPIIEAIDCHCAGMPARIVMASPELMASMGEVKSAMDRRKFMMENMDWLRTLMITEPRGYPCQNLDVVFPPTEACPEANFSFVGKSCRRKPLFAFTD